MASSPDQLSTSASRPQSRERRCLIALPLLVAILAGCERAPTPNPAIETTVRPIAETPISGLASITDVGSGRLSIHVGVELTEPAPPAADVRRGGCGSKDVVENLALMDPSNPFEFVGEIEGTLATVRPVAVIVLDAAGQPLACASFPMP